jgi:ribonuclease P protein component
VGKRVGGAVVRNRVRRRLRALIDELLTAPTDIASAPAVDIVITAFIEAADAPFEALRRDLASALRAAGIECAPTTREPTR